MDLHRPADVLSSRFGRSGLGVTANLRFLKEQKISGRLAELVGGSKPAAAVKDVEGPKTTVTMPSAAHANAGGEVILSQRASTISSTAERAGPGAISAGAPVSGNAGGSSTRRDAVAWVP